MNEMVVEILKKIFHATIGRYYLSPIIDRHIEKSWSVLDVGCGRIPPLMEVDKQGFRVGLDIYPDYIKSIRSSKIHDCYVIADAKNMPFKDDSFEGVVATEIIEHLTKDDGGILLSEIGRVGSKKMVLTTPNGFLETHAGPEDNPLEEHLCGYDVKELKSMGFSVRGISGYKGFWSITKGRTTPWIKPAILNTILLGLSEIIVYPIPQLAFQLFFSKTIQEKE